MLEFLEDNYRPWYNVLDGDEESQFFGPANLEDRPLHIGFEYQTHAGPERVYNYAVLRWVALRTGRKRKKFENATFTRTLPYYMFWSRKGSKPFPVIPSPPPVKVPSAYRDFVVDRYGLLAGDRTARELAWRNIPPEVFQRVSVTHAGKSPEVIRDALIRSGIERARIILQFIRAEVSRLDVLWSD